MSAGKPLVINGYNVSKIPVTIKRREQSEMLSGNVKESTRLLYRMVIANYTFDDIIKTGCEVLAYVYAQNHDPENLKKSVKKMQPG